jgi:hypothetical protein
MLLGSGFFESICGADGLPSVLAKIVTRLNEEKLLVTGPGCDVLVNPHACQAVAKASMQAFSDCGWRVKPPEQPEFLLGQRCLHGKFIFSASEHDGSNKCFFPWAYIGSGNLTSPGFGSRMGAGSGNLETGVIFEPRRLFWSDGTMGDDSGLATNRFPLNRGESLDELEMLSAGESATELVPQFFASPVSYFRLETTTVPPLLRAFVIDLAVPWDVIDPAGQPAPRLDEYAVSWPGPSPREVRPSVP